MNRHCNPCLSRNNISLGGINMKTFSKGFRIPILAFILIIILSFSFACSLNPAQTPSPKSSTPASSPPTASTVNSTVKVSPTPLYTPSPAASSTVLNPNWTPPALGQAPLPADLSGIVDQVLPSVVSINVQVTATNFFGQPTTQQGAGSGWIIDSNGLIVTNNHVVQGAQNVTVSLHDGKSYPAQKITADPISDLAVIKINATGLPAVKLGDSSKLKQGMMVVAIGNALGQGISVTAGWVSRLGVPLSIPATATEPGATLFDLIETSAPINPGNSGGPLVDMLGEVVGITNAKLVSTSVSNIGYAISIDNALPIFQQLIQTGHVIRPYLGVSLQDNTPMIASVYGLAVSQGAIITQVDPSGPAAKAGLKAGDVIVSIDSTNVANSADALQAILKSKIGQQVTVTYYRSSTKSTVQVTLVQNPNP